MKYILRQVKTQLMTDNRSIIIERYNSGESTVDISKSFNVSPNTIRLYLTTWNVNLRSSGRARKARIGNRIQCSTCLDFKHYTKFSKNKLISTGYNNRCKVCDSLYHKKCDIPLLFLDMPPLHDSPLLLNK